PAEKGANHLLAGRRQIRAPSQPSRKRDRHSSNSSHAHPSRFNLVKKVGLRKSSTSYFRGIPGYAWAEVIVALARKGVNLGAVVCTSALCLCHRRCRFRWV